jgi:hypothetical protein
MILQRLIERSSMMRALARFHHCLTVESGENGKARFEFLWRGAKTGRGEFQLLP